MPPQLRKDFLELVEKYLSGNASAEEANTIENYYSHFSNDPDITDSLNQNEIGALKAKLRQKIDSRINRAEKRVVPIYGKRSFQLAASILLFIVLSALFLIKVKQDPAKLQAQKHDLAPGG